MVYNGSPFQSDAEKKAFISALPPKREKMRFFSPEDFASTRQLASVSSPVVMYLHKMQTKCIKVQN